MELWGCACGTSRRCYSDFSPLDGRILECRPRLSILWAGRFHLSGNASADSRNSGDRDTPHVHGNRLLEMEESSGCLHAIFMDISFACDRDGDTDNTGRPLSTSADTGSLGSGGFDRRHSPAELAGSRPDKVRVGLPILAVGRVVGAGADFNVRTSFPSAGRSRTPDVCVAGFSCSNPAGNCRRNSLDAISGAKRVCVVNGLEAKKTFLTLK